MIPRFFAALAWFGVAVMSLLGGAASQEVVGSAWNFNGNVVLHRFNLLRLEIKNTTETPLQKTLRLSPVSGGLDRGAPLLQSVYLGAGATKKIQLHPYVESSFDSFQVTWVEGGPRRTLSVGGVAAPQVVFLAPPPLSSRWRIRIRRFSPEDLPSHSVGWGCLRGVVLDSVPDLAKAQRTALLEWLRRGGEVHILLRGPDHPRFGDDLEVLNAEEPIATYGQGRIYHHGFDRSACNKEVPKEIDPRAPSSRYGLSSPAMGLRTALQPEVQLQYSWSLIFLLTVAYVVLVGPVFYLLSTRRLSWVGSLGVLAGLVAASTWVFAFAGARSSLETGRVTSWSLAIPAGPGQYDVTRYASVFVVAGGTYTFTGDHYGFFSSAQRRERINGEIRNGTRPTYQVDMPGLSNRLIIQRAVLPGPEIEFDCDGRILRTKHPLYKVVSVHDRRIYSWTRERGQWVRNQTSEIEMSELLPWPDLRTAVFESMNLDVLDLTEPVTHAHQHVVFCEGPLVESFKLKGTGPRGPVENETGTTVFRLDITRQ